MHGEEELHDAHLSNVRCDNADVCWRLSSLQKGLHHPHHCLCLCQIRFAATLGACLHRTQSDKKGSKVLPAAKTKTPAAPCCRPSLLLGLVTRQANRHVSALCWSHLSEHQQKIILSLQQVGCILLLYQFNAIRVNSSKQRAKACCQHHAAHLLPLYVDHGHGAVWQANAAWRRSLGSTHAVDEAPRVKACIGECGECRVHAVLHLQPPGAKLG